MALVSLREYNREIERKISKGLYDEAAAHCRHIFKYYPKHVDTYRLLGKAYLEAQRFGDAADILQRVLSSVPDDFVSHIGMSIIREDEGNLDEALWHMERAFEVQPANGAVQDELRRLYGRRDGFAPPKVRLTRGALARMYVKGGLYQQAIAELRVALTEDNLRLDLQALLAQIYFLTGQRIEAAETCNHLLRKLPYCLEANRIMADVLESSERASEAKAYRERVAALEPYYVHFSPEYALVEDVPDAMISLEKLVWKADQPQGTITGEPEWASSRNAGSRERSGEDIPDWLAGSLSEESAEPAGDPISEGSPTPDQTTLAADAEVPDWLSGVELSPSEEDVLGWLNEPDQPDPAVEERPEGGTAAGVRLDEERESEERASGERASGEDIQLEGDDGSSLPDWLPAMEAEANRAKPVDDFSREDLGWMPGEDLSTWLEEIQLEAEAQVKSAQAEPEQGEPGLVSPGQVSPDEEERLEEAVQPEAPDLQFDSPAEEQEQVLEAPAPNLAEPEPFSMVAPEPDDEPSRVDALTPEFLEIPSQWAPEEEEDEEPPSGENEPASEVEPDELTDGGSLAESTDEPETGQHAAQPEEKETTMMETPNGKPYEPGDWNESGADEEDLPFAEESFADDEAMPEELPSWLLDVIEDEEGEPDREAVDQAAVEYEEPEEFLDSSAGEEAEEAHTAPAAPADAKWIIGLDEHPLIEGDTRPIRVPPSQSDREEGETVSAQTQDEELLSSEPEDTQPVSRPAEAAAQESAGPAADELLDEEEEPAADIFELDDENPDFGWLDELVTEQSVEELLSFNAEEPAQSESEWFLEDDQPLGEAVPSSVAEIPTEEPPVDMPVEPEDGEVVSPGEQGWIESESEAAAGDEAVSGEEILPEEETNAPEEVVPVEDVETVVGSAQSEPAEEVVLDSNPEQQNALVGVPQEQIEETVASGHEGLDLARAALSQKDLNLAAERYMDLIKLHCCLEEVLEDLEEAVQKHPGEVDLWQALGDAYMRSDDLHKALDAYSKAEELL